MRSWVDRLSLQRPTEPGLIAAASLRGWEGQSLEFIGDGVLRLVQTLHVLRALPGTGHNAKAQV